MNPSLEPMTGEELAKSLEAAENRVHEGIDPLPEYEEKYIVFGAIGTRRHEVLK